MAIIDRLVCLSSEGRGCRFPLGRVGTSSDTDCTGVLVCLSSNSKPLDSPDRERCHGKSSSKAVLHPR